ncbi:MAG TPA: hypothetical protein DCX89_02300 [Saprospirales bacterium]|nr:hypothetical protein [Saprospirales bacterium]HAY70701.1 hypothetical protein [Saprospirales bacterium]HRQ28860.1 penicillin-binding protein [Saprospiraceae bacterium]
MDKRTELLARVYVVTIFFVLFCLLVIGRLIDVNILEGEKWRSKLQKNIKWIEVEGDRGNIYADDGSILAASQPFFEIRFDAVTPTDKVFDQGVDSLAYYIATFLRPDKSPIGWKNELVAKRRNGARYYQIKNHVDYNMLMKIRNFPVFREGRIKGGLIEIQKSSRVKPYKEMASRTIGVDRKNAAKIGLEGSFDEFLKGQTIKRLYKKLPSKSWIPVQEHENMLLNKGSDLNTTLNIGISDAVHQAVLRKLQQTNAKTGVGIVMDVKTGEIKAMTNLTRASNGAYVENYNFAIGEDGKYNPGSTFKLATMLALLEDGHLTLETLVDLESGIKVMKDRVIKDAEPHNLRVVTAEKAFVISSNVGMAKLADHYYNRSLKARKSFVKRLKSFGLANKTGVDIEGEAMPVIKDPEMDANHWSGVTIPWMAHGYELEMTPLQLLTFYNAVANNGVMVKPYLVRDILREGKILQKFEPVVLNQKIASEFSIKQVKKLLEKVVEEGTGIGLKDNTVKIAGKTGTTRVNYNISEDEEEKVYNASFAGYFPADNPRYSCIVVLYGLSGQGNIYGSQVAAPVFGEIAERVMNFYINDLDNEVQKEAFASANLPKGMKGFGPDIDEILNFSNVPHTNKVSKGWIAVENQRTKLDIDEVKISRRTVPNVLGMGVRDAVYILENLGYKVKIEGVGRVAQQSIAPHTRNVGGTITLYLE